MDILPSWQNLHKLSFGSMRPARTNIQLHPPSIPQIGSRISTVSPSFLQVNSLFTPLTFFHLLSLSYLYEKLQEAFNAEIPDVVHKKCPVIRTPKLLGRFSRMQL